MRYALAFLIIFCFRLVSADDIDMTYSDCVASWGEPDFVDMANVQDPQAKAVGFHWYSSDINRPGIKVQFMFLKGPEPLWKQRKPTLVQYVFREGDDYKGHEKALEFNKGNSTWEKPEKYGDKDPITGITNGKYGERKWKRSDGKLSASLLDMGQMGWRLYIPSK